jgi:hypothetical protein
MVRDKISKPLIKTKIHTFAGSERLAEAEAAN